MRIERTPRPWPDTLPVTAIGVDQRYKGHTVAESLREIERRWKSEPGTAAALKIAKQLLDPLIQRTRTWTGADQRDYLAVWMMAEPENFARCTTELEKADARAALTKAGL